MQTSWVKSRKSKRDPTKQVSSNSTSSNILSITSQRRSRQNSVCSKRVSSIKIFREQGVKWYIYLLLVHDCEGFLHSSDDPGEWKTYLP